jgi:hypothetical protein
MHQAPAVELRAAPPTTGPRAEAPAKARPKDSPEGVLVCRHNQFARLKPKRSGLAFIGDELGDGEYIQQHRTAPDGKSVAFLHQTPVGMALSLWQFDQPWPGKVLSTSFIPDFFWMPDGKHLVLSSWGAIKDGMPGDFKFRLLDVATLKVADLKLPEGHWAADVSPDGKWFLTVKNVDPKDGKTGAQLYRVEHPSGKARLLFDKASIMIPPRWRISPDGKRVAGLHVHERSLQVFVGGLSGGPLRQVTREAPRLNGFFGWSPSGQKLLYAVTREPAQAKPKAGDVFHDLLVAVDADGRNREELHDNERHFKDAGGVVSKWVTDSLSWADWR